MQAGSTMNSLGLRAVCSFLWPPLGPWWGRGHRQWTQGLSWAWSSCAACVDARLVIRLRLWLGKQDALDKHLVHRCELLALHYACRRAPRPSQPPPELRSALSGMMPRPRDAQLCPAPPLPTALHHPGSFLSALTERSPPATRHSAAVVVVVINSTLGKTTEG